MGNPLRFALVFLAAFALTLSVAFAQDSFYKPPTKVTTSAVGTNPTGKAASGGISALLTMQGVDDSGRSAAYKSRSITYSPSTLGRVARSLRGGPAALLGALAFGALIDGAGWVIDELTGQVMDGVAQPTYAPAGTSYWSYDGKIFPSSSAAGAYQVGRFSPSTGAYYAGLINCGAPQVNGNIVCQISIGFSYPGFNNYNITHVANNSPGSNVNYSFPPSQPQAVPDSQVDDLVGNAISDRPDTWNQALRQPDGRPRVTPEVQAALDDYQQELEQQNGLTPSPDTPPVEDWETQPNDTATDWPGFCAWASTVCEFIDWYRAPADEGQDVELPVTEIPVVQSTWTSGLGSGSCPASSSISLSVWQGSISYQPVCDLASYIRPLVILSALLIGAFIISGGIRQNV